MDISVSKCFRMVDSEALVTVSHSLSQAALREATHVETLSQMEAGAAGGLLLSGLNVCCRSVGRQAVSQAACPSSQPVC